MRFNKHHILKFCILAPFLFMIISCSDVVDLQTNLSDADANEIISTLSHYGIEASKQSAKEGVKVAVSASNIARATEILQAAGLPRQHLNNLGDIFKKDGMISTPLEERVRYIHGLSDELETTLLSFDNVVSARVHVVLPERIAPGEPIQPSSAAVFIKYREPFDVNTNSVRIRNLVATSIPGLSAIDDRSKISVIFAPAASVHTEVPWEKVGPFTVDKSSASTLRYSLFAATGIMLLLVAGLLRILMKKRPVRQPKPG